MTEARMTSGKRFAERYPEVVDQVRRVIMASGEDPDGYVFDEAWVSGAGVLEGSFKPGSVLAAYAEGNFAVPEYAWFPFEAVLPASGFIPVEAISVSVVFDGGWDDVDDVDALDMLG